MQTAFNARALFTWKLDRPYRVYTSDGKLYFLRIGGQGGLQPGLTYQMGAIEALFGILLSAFQRKREETQADRADMSDPEQAVRAHKDSFLLSPFEVNETSIEPADRSGLHGVNAGQWLLSDVRGTKWRFQLESTEDMQAAMDILPGFFGDKLVSNVEWDAGRNRFVPRRQ